MHTYTGTYIDARTQDIRMCTLTYTGKFSNAFLHGCANENLIWVLPAPCSSNLAPSLKLISINADPSPSQESEDLEKQNAALRKEIKQLTEEMKYFTSVLSSHEPLCSVLTSSTPSPPEVVYSTHAFHQPHVSSPRFQP